MSDAAAAAPRAVRPTVAVGGIAFDDHGRVLLIQRDRPPSAGRWTIPGGRVEPGETLAQACARELAEETGLEVETGPLVEVLERIGRDPDAAPNAQEAGGQGAALQYHFVILDFLVHVRGGRLAAAGDARDARWCTAADLAALPLTEGLEPVLERARALARATPALNGG